VEHCQWSITGRIYSIELEKLETLKGNMGKLIEAHPSSSVSADIIAKLISKNNVSKVIDENGEAAIKPSIGFTMTNAWLQK
jgi:hypothetical protein